MVNSKYALPLIERAIAYAGIRGNATLDFHCLSCSNKISRSGYVVKMEVNILWNLWSVPCHVNTVAQ